MKKSLFIMLFISSFCYGQITINTDKESVEIGRIAPMGSFWISLNKLDDYYFFNYNNFKYTTLTDIKSFGFYEKNNDLENLYTLLIESLDNIPENEIKLNFDKCSITLKFMKSMGQSGVQFYHYENGVSGWSAYLTKKQIKKLFGKK